MSTMKNAKGKLNKTVKGTLNLETKLLRFCCAASQLTKTVNAVFTKNEVELTVPLKETVGFTVTAIADYAKVTTDQVASFLKSHTDKFESWQTSEGVSLYQAKPEFISSCGSLSVEKKVIAKINPLPDVMFSSDE